MVNKFTIKQKFIWFIANRLTNIAKHERRRIDRNNELTMLELTPEEYLRHKWLIRDYPYWAQKEIS